MEDELLFTVLETGEIDRNGTLISKYNDNVSYVKELVEQEFNSTIPDLIFNQKYPNLPTEKDVRYNKLQYFGSNFSITGIAELDDYYNWGYRNYEYGYFCIHITPTGGYYSDSWYIYASRSTFQDLFTKLQNGSATVTLVAQIIYLDTGSNLMATLIDYKRDSYTPNESNPIVTTPSQNYSSSISENSSQSSQPAISSDDNSYEEEYTFGNDDYYEDDYYEDDYYEEEYTFEAE